MSRTTWAPEERAEYDRVLQEVIEEAVGTRERVDLMEGKIHDARQAHRPWAGDVAREALRTGLAAQIKSYLKRTRVMYPARAAMVSKPRVIGVQRQDASGEVYDAQVLYEVATFDELRAKRREVLRQLRSYSDTVALLDRLLALADLYPSAATVQEALGLHEMSLDEYLLELPEAA